MNVWNIIAIILGTLIIVGSLALIIYLLVSEIIDLLLDRVSSLENNTLWLCWKNSKFFEQCSREK